MISDYIGKFEKSANINKANTQLNGVELLTNIISMQYHTSVQIGYENHFRDNKNKKSSVGHQMA